MIDLSLDSDMYDRQTSSYAAAMVSTSLGSVGSFRINSPSTPSTRPRYPPAQSHQRHNASDEPSPSSSDLSLDGLIDQFRASASSVVHSTARSQRQPSPAQSLKKPLARTHIKQPTMTKAQRQRVIPRFPSSSSSDSDSNERYSGGVSPMPKLNHLPKPKPSLQIPPLKKTTVISTVGKPMRAVERQPSPSKTTIAPPKRSRLPSPKKMTRLLPSRRPESPPTTRYNQPASPSLSLSDQSTSSSHLEDIEAPDSDVPPEEESLDDLIGHDLRKLQSLVSKSHVKFSPGKLPRSVRARRDEGDDEEEQEEATPRASSFRILSPPRMSRRPASSLLLRPVESILHREREDYEYQHNVSEDDSFAEELRALKRVMQKEKAAAKDADEKNKAKAEEKKEAEEEPGANIASLKAAVDVIDKTLLLALRPFEQMRQAMDQEEAKAKQEEQKTEVALELPMATQAIVEQLEQTFGSQTRQRQAELQAEEDASAAAKAAEEAKKKEEDEKKAATELARKLEEDQMLELIPLRGKLLTTEDDIHNTLLRLELAETLAREQASRHVGRSAPVEFGHELHALREYAMRRGQEIERGDQSTMSGPAPRAIDWHRSTFHLDSSNDEASPEDDDLGSTESLPVSFPDIVKKEVVEQLDYTMLKLRHALSVDEKEAQEAEAARLQAAEAERKKNEQQAEAQHKQAQIEADAAAARQRVMGHSSLDDLAWVRETDTMLQDSVRWDLATQRLEQSFAASAQYEGVDLVPVPSILETDTTAAAQRFDTIRMMMEAPYMAKTMRMDRVSDRYQPKGPPRSHSSHRNTVVRGRGRASDNQRDEADVPFRSSRERPDSAASYTHVQDRHGNQYNARPTRHELIPSSPVWSQVEHTSPSKASITSRRSHQNRAPREQLKRSMQLIQQLQADRREKTQWFHGAARYR